MSLTITATCDSLTSDMADVGSVLREHVESSLNKLYKHYLVIYPNKCVPTLRLRRAIATSMPARINNLRGKEELVSRLLTAKEQTGKTFTQIGEEIGLTNAYTAMLFYNQAQLKPNTVAKLRAVVPGIGDADIELMKKVPFRSYDPTIVTEPLIYRMQEAVLHYGEAVHAIVSEECGDGIMSAIDLFTSVDVVKGKQGEMRVSITLNGKFLPHIEQLAENNTAPLPPKLKD